MRRLRVSSCGVMFQATAHSTPRFMRLWAPSILARTLCLRVCALQLHLVFFSFFFHLFACMIVYVFFVFLLFLYFFNNLLFYSGCACVYVHCNLISFSFLLFCICLRVRLISSCIFFRFFLCFLFWSFYQLFLIIYVTCLCVYHLHHTIDIC